MLFVLAAVAAAGLAAVPGLPVSLLPNTHFPRVVVGLEAGDRPADRMVPEVTRPVEEAVRRVPGVRHLRSTTSRGSADVSVDFDWGTDMFVASLQIESAIARLLPELPAGVRFGVRRMDPTVFPVVGVSLRSDSLSLVELRELAVYELAPSLSAIADVAHAAVVGGRVREIHVRLDPRRLEAAGIAPEDVKEALGAAHVVDAVGRIEDREKLYLLVVDAPLRDLASLRELILREGPGGRLRLSDVASVEEARAPEWTRVVADGRDAVLLNVYQQPGGDTLRVADAVRERLRTFDAGGPGRVETRIWYDQSGLVRGSLGSVRDSMAVGILLAAAILWLFLRNGRLTAICVVAVPAALAGSLLILRVLGLGLNLMTLGGLAASVGLVVDDVIVVVEQIAGGVRPGALDAGAETLRASRGLLRPLTASSAATIIIFAPLAYLTGVTGALFRPLSLTVGATLALSYAVAWGGVPLLTAGLYAGGGVKPRTGETGRWIPAYDRLLEGLFGRPTLLMAGVAVLLGVGYAGYRGIGSELLPAMDEGGFILDYTAPAGTSLAETDRRLREVERILAEVPEVAAYSRRTGLSLGGFVTEANEGDYFVRLRSERRRSIFEVMDEVRRRIEREVPGLEVELAQLMGDLIGDLTAVPQPIEVKLLGDDPARLREAADRVAKTVSAIPGVVGVKSGVVLAGDAVQIEVDRQRGRLLGLDPGRVARFGRMAFEGELATEVQRGERMVGIRLWTGDPHDATVESLEGLRVPVPGAASVRLGRIAGVTPVAGQPQIVREDLRDMVPVTARIAGRDLGSVMREVRQAVRGVPLGRGVEVEYGGLYREQQRSFRGLIGVLGASTLLVLVLLLYLYERFTAVLAILLVSGLAASMTFAGLWVTGTDLDISALMGLTMIVGISAEASIFFMSEWRQHAAERSFEEGLLEAGRRRARPIVMTALAAIGALTPLALGIGEGAGMLRSLAIAIIAGLVATVPGVLVVLPVALLVLERGRALAAAGPWRGFGPGARGQGA